MSPLLELVWQAWFRPRDEPSAAEAVVQRSAVKPSIKKWALSHLEGFNAARHEQISTASPKQNAKAGEEISGDHKEQPANSGRLRKGSLT